ncbi:hypothetical protein [Mycolicibacterium mengxianglii]|uniref:hypothetical protein n=1 Tax=Mycolicibacterium mengxianglii TaxID=2736649 RepID=UPI0018D17DD3|nr:hypothetical protein [Mycolicibacterium mengxianglii]
MNLKSLATGVATAAGAVAVIGAATAGVTSIASTASAPAASTAIQPVSWEIPMPAAPAPQLQGALTQTLSALTSGSFSPYVEGGLGRGEQILADRAYRNAQAKGYFPVAFNVIDIDQNGPVATANVTATAANGVSTSRPLTFIAAPSPTGWVVQKGTAMAFLSSLG